MVDRRALFTVAVPTFNGARHLSEALRGVLTQEGVEWDLLVVDDRSEDGTLDVVREMAGDRARVVVNSERLGLGGNWNRCVALSETEWVSVFHQDDVMLAGHLAEQARVIAMRPDLGMVCSGGAVIDENGAAVVESVVEWPVVSGGDRVFEVGEFVRELAVGNPVRCSAVSLSRAAHEVLGGFDAAWKYAIDWEFWARMARRYPVGWRSRRTIAVRWHGASETHRFATGTLDLDEQARLIAEILGSSGWLDASSLCQEAERRLARGYVRRAYQAARAGDGDLCRRAMGEAWGRSPGVVGRFLMTDVRGAGRVLGGLVSR